jgi:serine/threonine-protein kinase
MPRSHTAELGTALAGRYLVEGHIGKGGMATVYNARDLKHDRPVALKVLNPELGAVLGAERFLTEIKVTATLQHPNLLTLIDSGEANGLLYYVMPLLDGETLRARLKREGQLGVDEAVRIAIGIGNALAYAHERGVIHRDLKPENIILQHGQPVVVDFGIALALRKAGGTRLTQTGMSIGTPQYMSPEQAAGEREIDGRADIYALGTLLFEMLAGEVPHAGPTAQAVIAKVMTTEARVITTVRPSVPARVADAIRKALSRAPEDRYATADEFVHALEPRTTGETLAPLTATMPAAAAPSAPSGHSTATLAGVAAAAAAAGFALGWILKR